MTVEIVFANPNNGLTYVAATRTLTEKEKIALGSSFKDDMNDDNSNSRTSRDGKN